jgi:hypothetical protein
MKLNETRLSYFMWIHCTKKASRLVHNFSMHVYTDGIKMLVNGRFYTKVTKLESDKLTHKLESGTKEDYNMKIRV